MDIQANEKEQKEISEAILKIWDACPESGELTEEQYFEICDRAYRLAELVTEAKRWERNTQHK